MPNEAKTVRKLCLLIAIAAVGLAPTLAPAGPIVNPGFESGDFTGWSVHPYTGGGGGPATVTNSTFGLPALQGDHSALLVRPGGDFNLCDPWVASCSPSFPPVQTPLAPQGPPIANPLTAFDIDALGFIPNSGFFPRLDWVNVLGVTFTASAYSKYAFDIQLLRAAPDFTFSSFVVLKDANLGPVSPDQPPPSGLIGLGTYTNQFPIGHATFPDLGTGIPATGFSLASNPTTYSITIPYDSTWELFFVIGHEATGKPASIGELIDNVRRVPEPGALSLMAVGVLFTVWILRRPLNPQFSRKPSHDYC